MRLKNIDYDNFNQRATVKKLNNFSKKMDSNHSD